MAKKQTKRTPKKRREWKKAFLAALAKSPNVSAAARKARIARAAVYEAREDEPFAKAWDDALASAIDDAEGEMYRRAVKGTRKPVYQGGVKVGEIQEYSDTLLIFLLKAHKPEKYRERMQIDVNALDSAITDELARVASRSKTEDARTSAGATNARAIDDNARDPNAA